MPSGPHSVLCEDWQMDVAFWKHTQEVSKKHRSYHLSLHMVRVTQHNYLTTSPRHRGSHTPAQAVPVGIGMEEKNRNGSAGSK